jgi:hypothetical protein
MSGADKVGRGGGTDPKAAGPNPQAGTKFEGGDQEQRQRDAIDKMNEPNKRDPATAERWFDRQLYQLYSDVISEPLPKDFLELIDKLREKSAK